MKLGIISSLIFVMAGCSHPQQQAKSLPPVVATMPADSHLVWCRGDRPEDCFTTAATFCADEGTSEGLSFTGHQHPSGHWHEVAEVGMAFPAMEQVADGWRMWIQCQP